MTPQTNQLEELTFIQNYNNKLNCKYFTTIRLESAKFQPGKIFGIIINHCFAFRAKIVSVKSCFLHQLPEMTACIDTGKTLYETQQLIRNIYAKHNIDFTTKKLSIVLMENLEYEG